MHILKLNDEELEELYLLLQNSVISDSIYYRTFGLYRDMCVTRELEIKQSISHWGLFDV